MKITTNEVRDVVAIVDDIVDIAKKIQDPTLCAEATNVLNSDRDMCYFSLQWTLKDTSLCKSINRDDLIKECLST